MRVANLGCSLELRYRHRMGNYEGTPWRNLQATGEGIKSLWVISYLSFHLLLHQVTIISILTGDVRLVDGGTDNQGRIEIYLNDTWWAICENHFSWHAFEIVCNMINLPHPHERYHNSEFGRGNQSILPMDFSCDGHESSLLDCRHEDYYEHHCGDEIVGMSCGELVMEGIGPHAFTRHYYFDSTHRTGWIPIIMQ